MEGSPSAGPSSAVVGGGKVDERDKFNVAELPPGFRFHPTDEEIIMHYLLKKVVDRRFTAVAVGEADLNKCEPWDFPKMSKLVEKEWFFFFKRDKKYPTGMRTNRATESGYWKATGKDKEIYQGKNNLVGMKKTLVFYKGRAPKGEKTNWVMHEYRLEGNFSNNSFSRTAKEEWVVSKVFHKDISNRRSPGFELARSNSRMDHLFDSNTLPPLADYNDNPSSSFANEEDGEGNLTSSRALLESRSLHMQHDQRDFRVTPQDYPINPTFSSSNSLFYSQIALPGSSYPTNMFPFKGGHQANPWLQAPKSELLSTNNSVISHSHDTGFSTENATNEITSMHPEGDIESKKMFDQEIDGLNFTQNEISDLDSLWSY